MPDVLDTLLVMPRDLAGDYRQLESVADPGSAYKTNW